MSSCKHFRHCSSHLSVFFTLWRTFFQLQRSDLIPSKESEGELSGKCACRNRTIATGVNDTIGKPHAVLWRQHVRQSAISGCRVSSPDCYVSFYPTGPTPEKNGFSRNSFIREGYYPALVIQSDVSAKTGNLVPYLHDLTVTLNESCLPSDILVERTS